jgi:hypothetical protein
MISNDSESRALNERQLNARRLNDIILPDDDGGGCDSYVAIYMAAMWEHFLQPLWQLMPWTPDKPKPQATCKCLLVGPGVMCETDSDPSGRDSIASGKTFLLLQYLIDSAHASTAHIADDCGSRSWPARRARGEKVGDNGGTRSIGQARAEVYALCMAGHGRLGAASPARVLDRELIRVIAGFLTRADEVRRPPDLREFCGDEAGRLTERTRGHLWPDWFHGVRMTVPLPQVWPWAVKSLSADLHHGPNHGYDRSQL